MLRILLVSLLFLTQLFSQSSQKFPFIGVSVSTQTLDINLKNKVQKAGFGLKYGQQTLDLRTTFSLEYNQNSYSSFSVEVDKILLDNMFGTPKLRPYLGAIIGYMKFNNDELREPFEETNGFYFGGNLGFIIYATGHIDIDISYHYYKIKNLDFLDDLHGTSLAAHYFF